MDKSKTLFKPCDAYQVHGDFNPQEFFVRTMINGIVNTAIPVRVDEVERPGEGGGAGYLKATPLVMSRDAEGNALPVVSIPRLRWFRMQHGTAAVICDPKVGDVGLAIVAHQDVSALDGGNEPKPAPSYRTFDISDAFYIGGFWGPKPTTFIRIEDTGDVTITAPASVVVNTKSATVNASESVKIDTPKTLITGDVEIMKTLTVHGLITGQGGIVVTGGGGANVTGVFTLNGSLNATDDVTAAGVSLKTHTHSNGNNGGSTGQPE